jgi:hypothetical protein
VSYGRGFSEILPPLPCYGPAGPAATGADLAPISIGLPQLRFTAE